MFKRRITTEQLNELTEEQKVKLRKSWKPQEGDKFILLCCHCNKSCIKIKYVHHVDQYGICLMNDNLYADKEDCLPLLDIGQMIELLESKGVRLDIYMNIFNKWLIRDLNKPLNENDESQFLGDEPQGELVDAFFEACKEVL